MGLDTSHDAWHGSYSSFMRWRKRIANVAGLPPLELMEGFYQPLDKNRKIQPLDKNRKIYTCDVPTFWTSSTPDWKFLDIDKRLPISWDCLKPSPLHELLHHSDCDGEIPWEICSKIADCLESLIPLLPQEGTEEDPWDWKDKTRQFVEGLRLAFSLRENLIFA